MFFYYQYKLILIYFYKYTYKKMSHHKKQKHCKKESKKDCCETKSKSQSCLTSYKPKPHPKPQCGCEQLFYAPLPNLPIRPPTQFITPGEWFAPGSVQSCCSICSTVKPVYATPCTGYCCKQY